MLNIPMFSRAYFNKYMTDNYSTFSIIPTDEAYDSYRHFVMNKFAPIGHGPVIVGETDDSIQTVERLDHNQKPFVSSESEVQAVITIAA